MLKEFVNRHPIISFFIADSIFVTARKAFNVIENVLTYASYTSAYKKYIEANAMADGYLKTPERYGILYSSKPVSNGSDTDQYLTYEVNSDDNTILDEVAKSAADGLKSATNEAAESSSNEE